MNAISIDFRSGQVEVGRDGAEPLRYPLASAEGFREVSRAWLRAGWEAKYVYSFTWLGRPIIQLPEDVLRIQEVIFAVRPDVIVETGVAHGGSLVFYASLLQVLGGGRVIGIDVEIRPHNRRAIESHFLAPRIHLVEGDSVAPDVVGRVRGMVGQGERVLVLLDSCHSKAHVTAELEAYAPLVSVGSYVVATDGIMEDVVGLSRTHADWGWNNPRQAALDFARRHPEFSLEEPAFPFNEGLVRHRVTYWPSAFLRRVG
jgi:cephalosporin hydroxylase